MGDAGGGSIFTNIRKLDDLYRAGIEIEHARRGEDQVKLHRETERLDGAGRKNRVRRNNRVGRQGPVLAHRH